MNLKKILPATTLFTDFFNSEKSGGILLIFITITSLILSNTAFGTNYIEFWNTSFNHHTITHWINDGLMTIFFLLIGLELEREIYDGELSDLKSASLPIFAALGGMIVPAGIFIAFNYGTATQDGAGIPMATDIAFAIAILSLLGSRIPLSLKIFLTALAVMDDLGAIIIISIFYTNTISLLNLFLALGTFGILLVLNRLKIRNLIPYLIGGVIMWYFMLQSGVHATITGVLLAFAIPFGNGDKKSSSYILQHFLHKPVAFIILPIFALASTAIAIPDTWQTGLLSSNSIGIILGLSAGKAIGIFLFSFLGVSLGLCSLPSDLNWKNIIGVGFLGGIGFTMSIFITVLAFDSIELVNESKIAIIIASIISAILGLVFLRFTIKKNNTVLN
ncbi:Na+/H+ antiporter NhaA [uncultured Cytophaga sp.]|uniref:Na+/H+ antiporter NhaA n=1 Tax=uncultured Cytophaga sp. TaxID=160238 RepID=UPI00261FC285|nr:Na+/H+ antiporter NhaA [uncultured Cytophaga sp.]